MLIYTADRPVARPICILLALRIRFSDLKCLTIEYPIRWHQLVVEIFNICSLSLSHQTPKFKGAIYVGVMSWFSMVYFAEGHGTRGGLDYRADANHSSHTLVSDNNHSRYSAPANNWTANKWTFSTFHGNITSTFLDQKHLTLTWEWNETYKK